jgi:hydroxyacylglutathione hydrolase
MPFIFYNLKGIFNLGYSSFSALFVNSQIKKHMYIEQLYTACLSEAAYYIESNGEAAIIDPLRDTQVYLDKAKERNATIKYIFETHFHADFVSGHVDLAQITGAPIIYGPMAGTHFKIQNAQDMQEYALGDCTIQALHTPGHTMESTCYLLKDNNGKNNAIFTGDTLFVGDVGRPDLFGGTYTKEHLASMMYHSLQNKILPLENEVIVYPAHGAGSACGKNIGKETFSTIGEQKKSNYALQPQTEDEFVQAITSGLSTPPAYFPINAKINKEGYDALNIVMEQSMVALSIEEIETHVNTETIILDTRPAVEFTNGFIPSSINIGLENRFAEWAGTLLPYNKQIVLITKENQLEESITRLSRVGLDNVIGYLQGGFEAWQSANKEIDMIIDIDADELAMDINYDEKIEVIDVRKESEFDAGHVTDAIHKPLSTFQDAFTIASLNDETNMYVYCGGGYRSVIACSIMKREGIHNLRNVLGGWSAIKNIEQMPLSAAKKETNA